MLFWFGVICNIPKNSRSFLRCLLILLHIIHFIPLLLRLRGGICGFNLSRVDGPVAVACCTPVISMTLTAGRRFGRVFRSDKAAVEGTGKHERQPTSAAGTRGGIRPACINWNPSGCADGVL